MSNVIQGDCIEEMKEMDENSVDAVVTDPPYGLAFMGKEWDDFEPKEFQEFCQEWGEQALRVLKPGGHLLAFCGTRTYHRMVVGLEDAGFEIRDQIAWMYGSGFPKGQDISKAVDKKKGVEDERKVVGEKNNINSWKAEDNKADKYGDYKGDFNDVKKKTAPASDKAEKWSGWNTSLKPGHEPIVVAQKPKEGTYAENIIKYGVGGLNIESCRISTNDNPRGSGNSAVSTNSYSDFDGVDKSITPDSGRWPSNVVLDQKASKLLDQQTGNLKPRGSTGTGGEKQGKDSMFNIGGENTRSTYYGDGNKPSRFFYSAKAQKNERNAGLSDLDEKEYVAMSGHKDGSLKTGSVNKRDNKTKNDIATLKPINLMRWLTRLVTPEDGTVLDPFAGSGTTGCACEIEGFDYVLIEKRERFAKEIIPKRVNYWSNPSNWDNLKDHNELESKSELQNGSLNDF